ncbi:HAD family phosphatase [Streptomyces sp. NBC_00322]|uniref:HAD family hydrolase n=1 Tax=Streptomyces sp. NBC_00322 TaxID=2975712 RepID=UPI002E2C4EE1|nr:HAD family phosphatase [Streptomyces sp. NBC_00322]
MDSRPAVIFDLDGTLVDSERHHYEASRGTLAEHGVTDYAWERHAEFIGIGTRETLEILRAHHRIPASLDGLLAANNHHYVELARRSSTVFPQMRLFVEMLHEAGHPMAVASGSSKAAIDAVLAGSGLGALIATVVSSEEVRHGKPAPDVFLEAARRLNVIPSRCTVVEDSAPGTQAARRAGMRCIAVPQTKDQARDPHFSQVDLLFEGGHKEFTASAAYAWLTAEGPRKALTTG